MKRNTLFVFLFSVFFLPIHLFAISGACSYHGGVNCSSGASTYGNAVCNDGWISSTSYYLTDECKSTYYSLCYYPTSSGCTTQSDLARYQSTYNVMAAMYGVNTNMNSVTQCQQEIDAYTKSMQTYNQCEIDWYLTEY